MDDLLAQAAAILNDVDRFGADNAQLRGKITRWLRDYDIHTKKYSASYLKSERLIREEFREIKQKEVVSFFWMTDTKARAKRISWMEKIGILIRKIDDKRHVFPYCVFVVNEKRLEEMLKKEQK